LSGLVDGRPTIQYSVRLAVFGSFEQEIAKERWNREWSPATRASSKDGVRVAELSETERWTVAKRLLSDK
jgi:hypothetical protein